VRNITLSADEELIEAARTRARLNKTSLNELFRQWLADYASPEKTAIDVKGFLAQFPQWHIEKMPTRDELNER
jgi:hypothetical protein